MGGTAPSGQRRCYGCGQVVVRRQLGAVRVPSRCVYHPAGPHIEFRVLEQLGQELATFTPVAWVGIFRRRIALRQGSDYLNRFLPAVPAVSLAVIANQVAATHFQVSPFCFRLQRWPGRRGSLVCFCALLVAAQLVRLSYRQPRLSTSLLPNFCCPRSVFLVCSGHLAQFVQLMNSFVWLILLTTLPIV